MPFVNFKNPREKKIRKSRSYKYINLEKHIEKMKQENIAKRKRLEQLRENLSRHEEELQHDHKSK